MHAPEQKGHEGSVVQSGWMPHTYINQDIFIQMGCARTETADWRRHCQRSWARKRTENDMRHCGHVKQNRLILPVGIGAEFCRHLCAPLPLPFPHLLLTAYKLDWQPRPVYQFLIRLHLPTSHSRSSRSSRSISRSSSTARIKLSCRSQIK